MVRVLIAVLVIPLGLDLYVPVPEENLITLEKIDLGRRLFHDRRLSRDQSVACVSCHDPDRAFSTAEAVTPGVFGRRGKRNAPALINRAWGRSFFWDARVGTLEEQVLQPIEDSKEMDLSIDEASRRVGVAVPDMSRALATYIRSIMSGNAPYDRFVNGDRTALSAEAQIGLQVFRGKGNCSACHVGPNFTDEKLHNTGIAWAAAGTTGSFLDEGRGTITGRPEDRGAFKTPTLREIERSAPYMHDGSFASLHEVVDYYDRGGNRHALLNPEVRPIGLTTSEKHALIAFLRSLSGNITR
ncbi:MAG: cytochrome-c peroxidase [Acidobacteriota bacterium]|nr:cytochrome-c peroxidase [Acidobacteriota bacterium]